MILVRRLMLVRLQRLTVLKRTKTTLTALLVLVFVILILFVTRVVKIIHYTSARPRQSRTRNDYTLKRSKPAETRPPRATATTTMPRTTTIVPTLILPVAHAPIASPAYASLVHVLPQLTLSKSGQPLAKPLRSMAYQLSISTRLSSSTLELPII